MWVQIFLEHWWIVDLEYRPYLSCCNIKISSSITSLQFVGDTWSVHLSIILDILEEDMHVSTLFTKILKASNLAFRNKGKEKIHCRVGRIKKFNNKKVKSPRFHYPGGNVAHVEPFRYRKGYHYVLCNTQLCV